MLPSKKGTVSGRGDAPRDSRTLNQLRPLKSSGRRQLNVRLSEDLHRELSERAAQPGASITGIVTEALWQKFGQWGDPNSSFDPYEDRFADHEKRLTRLEEVAGL